MDQLDHEGYIRPEADLANVQPGYQGLPDATAGLLAEAFGPRLHSAYLYGSVVRGNAVPGRSDVDVIAVLWAAPVEEDRVRADRVERALVERFPVLFSAGVGLTHRGCWWSGLDCESAVLTREDAAVHRLYPWSGGAP